MTRPTLSVVMPNYNHARFLDRSIPSIVEQSRPPDELLILDDASTDNSVTILESYAARYPIIRLLRNDKNEGVNAANRRLFAQARGDWIHPAAADDERLPGFFESAMAMAESHPQAGLVFGRVTVKNERDEVIGDVSVARWTESLYADPARFLHEYLDAELASHSASGSTIYRREPFTEVGGYRQELGPWADTFAARAIGLKYGAAYAPEPFAVDYRLPGSYSERAKDEPRRVLDVVARAAHLMRSEEFRDRFPGSYVARWERQFRRLVAWNYFLGSSPRRRSFLIRNLQRLPRVAGALRLLTYRGDVSCYDAA